VGKIKIYDNGTTYYVKAVIDAESKTTFTGCIHCGRSIRVEKKKCFHCGKEQDNG
jgi:ribosomal protein L37E